jgi:hypothetical protein
MTSSDKQNHSPSKTSENIIVNDNKSLNYDGNDLMITMILKKQQQNASVNPSYIRSYRKSLGKI